jgi:hypothetical protein
MESSITTEKPKRGNKSMPLTTRDIQVIVAVGADGGSLTLQGVSEKDSRWRFRCVRNESALADLLPNEFSPEQLFAQGDWVTSWDDALAHLDKYRWAGLFPLTVHPLFADQIWAAVGRRLSTLDDQMRRRKLNEWKRLCTPGVPHDKAAEHQF